MSNSIFHLEQQIQDCWKVTDDMGLVASHIINTSELSDAEVMYKYIVAIKDLYELKFQNMWDTFDKVCKEYHIAHKQAGLERDKELQSLFDEKELILSLGEEEHY